MITPVSSIAIYLTSGTPIDIVLVPEDTFRILVATDNHIGYNERDPIRGQDSINTFREILQLAVKNDVSEFKTTFNIKHK